MLDDQWVGRDDFGMVVQYVDRQLTRDKGRKRNAGGEVGFHLGDMRIMKSL